jgi:transcriptional regulator GlxA family with amidase domain
MKKTKIIFLILPHVHLLDLAGPDQVFLEAKDHGVDITVEYCSIDGTVTASCGMGISKLKRFNRVAISKGDYVFIPGADVHYLSNKTIPFEKEMKNWLKSGYEKGAYLCSVCTGAFFLARLALLDGKKSTTHWKRTKELQQKFPAVSVQQDILFTEDERIFTSAGVAAGIDLALHIVSRLKDEHTVYEVPQPPAHGYS